MLLRTEYSGVRFCVPLARLLVLGLFASAVVLLSGCGGSASNEDGVNGSDYPSKDIEFIVPTDPGGGYDTWARLVAPYIEKNLPNDASVVVKNVPGAGTVTGSAQLYIAEPDGYTIGILNMTLIAAEQVVRDVKYDVSKYSYLGRLTSDPRVVTVAGNSNVNTIEELRESSPIKLAEPGFQPESHILMDKFGIEYSVVLHDANTEARLSIIRGDADAGVSSLESMLGDLESGDLKAILYAGEEKPEQGEPGYEAVADLPTVADAGYPELAGSLATQRLIAAPPNLPEEVKQVLEQAVQDALNDPEFHAQVEESELTLAPLTGDETSEIAGETLDTFLSYQDLLKEAQKEAQ